jgi:hypothetical protein
MGDLHEHALHRRWRLPSAIAEVARQTKSRALIAVVPHPEFRHERDRAECSPAKPASAPLGAQLRCDDGNRGMLVLATEQGFVAGTAAGAIAAVYI